ncbi:hypothetical protein [Polyangium sp. 6x1]|uniref:hypothetical protein n=1 Tax=Polyangium sp. 6x1 TaxID=3042689 RepID=UPI00248228B6|nr:hypothetical protein [Polyangium sp. 6x1]MDI1442569.1 hypothetical protein [Polyangium sp. 6x1]
MRSSRKNRALPWSGAAALLGIVFSGSAAFAAEMGASDAVLAAFGPEGMRFSPRNQGPARGMTLTGAGCKGDPRPVGPAVVHAAQGRVEYVRHGVPLVEWYEQKPEGIEQGFTLAAPPCEKRGFELSLALSGMEATPGASAGDIALRDASGGISLRYGELSAFDALGRVLPSRMEVEGGRVISLRVDDAGAVYPVMVDPLVVLNVRRSLITKDVLDVAFYQDGRGIALEDGFLAVSFFGPDLGGLYPPGTRFAPDWQKFYDTSSPGTGFPLSPYPYGALAIGGRSLFIAPSNAPIEVYEPQPNGTLNQTQIGLVGSGIAASGTTMAALSSGSLYVHVNGAQGWAQEAVVPPPGGGWQAPLAVSGDRIALFSGNRVVVLLRSNGIWDTEATLPFPMTGTPKSLALSGTALVLGMPDADIAATGAGALQVHVVSGGVWVPHAILTASDAAAGDKLGASVDIDADTIVAGAPGKNGDEGMLYVFGRTGSLWFQHGSYRPSNYNPFPGGTSGPSKFGSSVVISGDVVAATAPSEEGYYSQKPYIGAEYAFRIDVSCKGPADCPSGFCVDGVCCDTACGGGDQTDCMACSTAFGAPANGTCVTVPTGGICRVAAGVCDVPATCNAGVCPPNAAGPAGILCREKKGDCDVEDFCDGVSPLCPPDQVLPAGTFCNPASASPCDVDDTCTGISPYCLNKFAPPGTICRPQAGPCDKAEVCTGSIVCPKDTFLPAGIFCRVANGPCDKAEACSGASIDCPADAFLPAATTCRVKNGACDTADSCSGVSVDCPDAVQPAGVVCRNPVTECDVAETCDGSGTSCPANEFAPDGSMCSTGLCMTGLCMSQGGAGGGGGGGGSGTGGGGGSSGTGGSGTGGNGTGGNGTGATGGNGTGGTGTGGTGGSSGAVPAAPDGEAISTSLCAFRLAPTRMPSPDLALPALAALALVLRRRATPRSNR